MTDRTSAGAIDVRGSLGPVAVLRCAVVPILVLSGLLNPDVAWPGGAYLAAAALIAAASAAAAARRLSASAAFPIAIGCAAVDFLVSLAFLMLVPDHTVPIPLMFLILVAIEAGYLFQWRGSVGFGVAFLSMIWLPFIERRWLGYDLPIAPFLLEASVVLFANGVIGALTTISETRRVAAITSAAAAGHQAQLNATLALVARQLLSALRQDAVLEALDTALASTVLPWRHAVLCRDDQGQFVTRVSSLAREGGRHLGSVWVSEASLTGSGASPAVSVVLGSVTSKDGAPLDLGTTRGLIAIRGECKGVLVAAVLVGADDPEALGEQEMAFFEALAYQMSAALDKAALYENVEALALTDALTHLQNRRAFETRLAEEIERSDRYGQPFALLMIDIDHFKMLNDSQGHPAGDRALFRIGELLSSPDLIRRVDQSYRIGGEEFTVILPAITLHDALGIAERIRERVGSDDIPEAREQPLGHLTISVGVALHTQGAGTAKDLVVATDLALYEAKRSGRDCVRTSPLVLQASSWSVR